MKKGYPSEYFKQYTNPQQNVDSYSTPEPESPPPQHPQQQTIYTRQPINYSNDNSFSNNILIVIGGGMILGILAITSIVITALRR